MLGSERNQIDGVPFVGCPWQARNYSTGDGRCEWRIAMKMGDGNCVGEACEQYIAHRTAGQRVKELHEEIARLGDELRDLQHVRDSRNAKAAGPNPIVAV